MAATAPTGSGTRSGSEYVVSSAVTNDWSPPTITSAAT